MRRGFGIGAIQNQQIAQKKYDVKGSEIQEAQFEQIKQQFELFRTNLESFAKKYRNDIRKNAQLRKMFQEMCSAIGVDPLTSAKDFWSILGIGDFYFELAVQILEICMSVNEKNGGLISLNELTERLQKLRRSTIKDNQAITYEDVICAVKKLKILGNGFTLVPITGHGQNQYMIQSIPGELSLDHTAILNYLNNSNKAFISVNELVNSHLNWNEQRTLNNLNQLLINGMIWIDSQNDTEPDVNLYWFPSFFSDCVHSL